MNKTIITLLIGGAVLGGGYAIYSGSRNAEQNSLLTIEGTNLEGVFQQITFSSTGCTYVEGNGDKRTEGFATIQDVETTCGISDDIMVSNDQFSCATDLC